MQKGLWDVIKQELYCTFWMLSLENINVNQEVYKAQIAEIKENISKKWPEKNKKEKDKPKELRDLESILKKLETELEIYTKRYE